MPTRGVVAFLDSAGTALRDSFFPVDLDTDDLVLTRVGDDALWVVWTAVGDPVSGFGTIMGGLMTFPEGEWVVAPQALSRSESAARPHTDATALPDDGWRVAVSWEESDADGVRSVHGRTGTVR